MLSSSPKETWKSPLTGKRLYLLLASALISSALLALISPPGQASVQRFITCRDSACLTRALRDAQPGNVIALYPGIYNGNFELHNSGTSSAPIVIKTNDTGSSRTAVLNGRGADPEGTNYTLHITGDYVHVENLHITGLGVAGGDSGTDYTLYITGDYVRVTKVGVTGGKKGIMLDNANHNLIDRVKVADVGEEGVHFRDGSSYNTIQDSDIYNTGRFDERYGEGVYVGSDVCKWNDREAYPSETGDCEEERRFDKRADYNIIYKVRIGPNVTAESVDIKEGTTGTVVHHCAFDGRGISGANSADSLIDVKGNASCIRYNNARSYGNPKIADAFQVHEIVTGWGINNVFIGNVAHLDKDTSYLLKVDSKIYASAIVYENVRYRAGNTYSGRYRTLFNIYSGSYRTLARMFDVQGNPPKPCCFVRDVNRTPPACLKHPNYRSTNLPTRVFR